MSYDKFYGPHEQLWGWKCLICGEIVDPVILGNRQLMRVGRDKPPKDEKVKKIWTRPLVRKNTG